MTQPDPPPPWAAASPPVPTPPQQHGEWQATTPDPGHAYGTASYDPRFGPWGGAGQPGGAPIRDPLGASAHPPARPNRSLVWALVACALIIAAAALAVTAIGNGPSDRSASDPTRSRPVDRPPVRTTPAEEVIGVPPAAPPPATVLDACTEMMPALIESERRLVEASSEAETMQVVADMQAAVIWAGAAPDPLFQQHLEPLAADLQAILDATRAREEPPGLAADIEDHSFVVGKDCGLNGWTE